ncbi:MAG TPA: D-alanine--D-alanine ligase A, partial [Pseudomonadales bacterium]|nr:D-alanine--D-alanine ligase A [Pseudomonadales bacterium]
MSRTRVLLIFGGQSAEHEISVISARSVCAAIDSSRYEVIRVGITRSGEWFLDDDQERLLGQKEVTEEGFTRVRLSDASLGLTDSHGIQLEQTQFDVVFPLLHGPRGEDGTMQGLLELAGAAYVGAGV